MEWSVNKTINFIKDYKNCPELWDIKNPGYKDNRMKIDKLKQLSLKYNGSINDIKKKIKNLRTAFHREHRKYRKMKKNGSTHKIWFAYNFLKFLLDVEIHRRATIAQSDGEDSEVNYEVVHNSLNIEEEQLPPITIETEPSTDNKKKKKFPSEHDDIEEDVRMIMKNVKQHLTNSDEYSAFGNLISHKIRNLRTLQLRRRVQNQIWNVLVESEMCSENQDVLPIPNFSVTDSID